MLLRLLFCCIACLMLAAQACAAAKPFVTVNGKPVSQATADLFMTQARINGMPDSPSTRETVREELIRRELLYQAAKKSGFAKKQASASLPKTATETQRLQTEATLQTMVIRAYLEDFLRKHPVTDTQLQASYDARRAAAGATEYKARHILVSRAEDALEIIASLDKGGRFEDLARRSIAPGAAASGGDLGWAAPARYVKPFATALVSLEKGKYTTSPIKTQFGYHVIRLDDTRPLKVPSFAEMRPLLHKETEANQVEVMVAEMRAKARIH